jgi:hypothetical protein
MMRSASFASGALAGVLGLAIVGTFGFGVAAAANGGSLTLGHTNTATATTTLKDTHGTPLSLDGSTTKSPLKVNSSKEVAHLNASAVDGKSAGALETSGSDGHLNTYKGINMPVDPSLPFNGAVAAQTATLAKGTYFVTSWATLDTTGITTGRTSHCFIGLNDNSFEAFAESETESDGYDAISTTWPVTLKSAGKIGEYCWTQATSAVLYGASITAIRMAHATVGTNVNVVQTGIHPITSH